jgi:peptidyl-dipeptidase Dcp
MKLILILIAMIHCAQAAESHQNVFLQPYNTPFESVPFNEIQLEDYTEALEKGLKEQEDYIQALATQPQAPTFENTIEALEKGSDILDRVTSVLFNLTEAATCDQLDEIANHYSPILSEASNKVFQNKALFERVKTVYQQEKDKLTGDKRKLLEDTYLTFIRSGANLNEQDKAAFSALCSQLSTETLTFDSTYSKKPTLTNYT